MEDKTNVIKIQRYHSPCGDLMLGSLEDKLCLCDWAAESHRDIVDRRLRKVLKAGYEESTSDVIQEAMSQLDEYSLTCAPVSEQAFASPFSALSTISSSPKALMKCLVRPVMTNL